MRSSPCRYAFLDAPRGFWNELAKRPGRGSERLCRREPCWPFVWAGRWRPGVMVRGTGSGTSQAKRPGHDELVSLTRSVFLAGAGAGPPGADPEATRSERVHYATHQ